MAEGDPVGRLWDNPGTDGRSMREQLCQVVAHDRWSLVAMLRVAVANGPSGPPKDGRASVVLAVYPGYTTTERAKEIVGEAWRTLAR